MTHSVLLVDDEQGVCAALKRTFRKTLYKVFEANSGDQALTLLANNDVDVVISDQRMPGMNGTELLTIVKQQYPKVGRVMLSAYSDFDALTGAINEACIFRFIPKPWNDEELLQTVDESIIKGYTQPSELLTRKETIYRSLNVSSQPIRLPIATPKQSIQSAQQKGNVDSNVLLWTNDAAEPFLKKQMLLEQDIKNDELSLTQLSLINIENSENTLHYLLLNWPRYERFTHDHMIDMAREAGYLKELYTWYTLKCADIHYTREASKQDTPKKVVIDLFCEEMINDKSLIKTLLSITQKNCRLIFRVPFPLHDKESLDSLLEETHIASSSVMLKIGKRIIDIDELESTHVKYLELDARYNTIRNASLTEKRIKMLGDAKKLSIKTILTEVKDSEQLSYAKQMNIDFFSRKLNKGIDIK